MNLRRVLSKETILCRLVGESKEGVIEELIDVLEATGRLRDRKAALKAVMERERRMSTGLQNGIAIPHGKTDSVEQLVAALGIKPEGIPFDSLDGQPARIILITISPASRPGPHIQFLAEISRALNDPAVRQRVLDAATEEEVLGILTGEAAPEQAR